MITLRRFDGCFSTSCSAMVTKNGFIKQQIIPNGRVY
jgi:hypothetical protein